MFFCNFSHHRRSSSGSSSLSSSFSSPSLSTSLPQTSDSTTFRVSTTSNGVVLKRRNATRRDTKRVPYKYQKDRRAKFKSTEDLLHRLYVCISGAADQVKHVLCWRPMAVKSNIYESCSLGEIIGS